MDFYQSAVQNFYEFAMQKMKEKQVGCLSEAGNLRVMVSTYESARCCVCDDHDEALLRRMEVEIAEQKYLVSIMYDEYYIQIRRFFRNVVRWQLTE